MSMFRKLLLLVLVTATAQAQTDNQLYFGVSFDAITDFQEAVFFPIPTFQVGSEVRNGLELRASIATLVIVSLLQGDVLYTSTIPDTDARFYLGGGPDLGFATLFGGGAAFGLHGTLGAGYSLSPVVHGFSELQPVLFSGVFIIRGRVGLNFYL